MIEDFKALALHLDGLDEAIALRGGLEELEKNRALAALVYGSVVLFLLLRVVQILSTMLTCWEELISQVPLVKIHVLGFPSARSSFRPSNTKQPRSLNFNDWSSNYLPVGNKFSLLDISSMTYSQTSPLRLHIPTSKL